MVIDIGFDPIAFVTSLFAVWFAYTEAMKNNKVCVKLISCKATSVMAHNENRGQMFAEFSILIRNYGISIHDPTMTLNFQGKGGLGRVNIPIKRRDDRTGEHSEFARGMLAEFCIKSFEVDPHFRPILEGLEDFAGRDTRLILYSQMYTAKNFPVGRWQDRLARRWNSFAYRINRKFDKKIGENTLKLGKVLPADATDIERNVQMFVLYTKEAFGE